MVNKQYNVQSLNKKIKQESKRSSPPSTNRQITVLASLPNYQSQNSYNVQRNSIGHYHLQNQCDNLSDTNSTYGQNITLNTHFDFVDSGNDEKSLPYDDANVVEHHQLQQSSGVVRNKKDLTINDIERFQYILQMDREMVSKNDVLYLL